MRVDQDGEKPSWIVSERFRGEGCLKPTLAVLVCHRSGLELILL